MNVSLREELSRMAHLLCEMMTHMETIGRARDGNCVSPVTQEDLGEATLQSSVHVNRVLQALRRQELNSFGKVRLTIQDRDGLVEVRTSGPHTCTSSPPRQPERWASAERLGGKQAA